MIPFSSEQKSMGVVAVRNLCRWRCHSVNRKRFDNKLNIFEGILKNRYFILITLIGGSVAFVPEYFDTNNNGW
jgi:hypothetical protein